MKIRRQVTATARKKNLKVQHHKMNSRRQFFFNQAVNQAVSQVMDPIEIQESSIQIKTYC